MATRSPTAFHGYSTGPNDPQISVNIDSWFPAQSVEGVVIQFSTGTP